MTSDRSAGTVPPRVATLLLTFLLLAAGCAWPTLGYNAARGGNNPSETTLRIDNVAGLQEQWSAAAPGDSPAVVAGGTVFVQSPPQLLAFSANGTTGCSGTPRVCAPLWSAAGGVAPPTVANGIVYVPALGNLRAYDAQGVDHCGGTPKTCQPLWTAPLGTPATLPGSPAVANGIVFVGDDKLYAFDAAGSTGCTGTPKTCQPLWTADGAERATPSVANGVVYVAATDTLAAFDAAGTTGCSGSPKTCAPLWTYQKDLSFCIGSCELIGPPSIVAGRVYVLDPQCCEGGQSHTTVLQFDAAGQQGCTGNPKTCAPLAAAPTAGFNTSIARAPVASANGIVYSGDLALTAYAANGLAEQWESTGNMASSPTLANGVLYAIGATLVDTQIHLGPVAYDASGQQSCSGTPKRCTPVWTGPLGPLVPLHEVLGERVGPTIANGTVFVRTDRLRAYALP